MIIIDLSTNINLYKTIDIYKQANKNIIVWTARLDDSRLTELFKLQLDGYFYNGMEKEELFKAVTTVLNGQFKKAIIIIEKTTPIDTLKIDRSIVQH